MALSRRRPHWETGIPWQHAVPDDWRPIRIKYVLREKKSRSAPELPCGAISFGQVIYKDGERIADDTRATYQEVRSGEYLVNPINLNYDLKSLRTALSSIDVCVSPAYIVLQLTGTAHKKFLHYLLYQFDVAHMKTLGAGVRQTITFEDIGQCSWCLPPIAEQESVANFLDRETARIDALIEKKTRFIELLSEKRHALITQAVTRGLDPGVPMRESGFEWLGRVPAHWQVTRLRFVIESFDQGWSPECFAYPAGRDEWGIVKAGCVNRGVFDPVENKRLPDEFQPRTDIEIRPGDVLMSRASGSVDLIGSVALATATEARLMLSDKIFRLKLCSDWDAEFFVLTMQSNALREQIKLAVSGAEGLANNLAQARINDFLVVQPPIGEQQTLVQAANAQLERLGRLQAKTEASVSLLRERRAALITAAVTGQIDVRDEIPSETPEPA